MSVGTNNRKVKDEQPKNVKAVLAWIQEKRPDLSDQFEEIFTPLVPPNLHMEALAGMVLMGFEAGRMFEKAHPEVESGIGYMP